jgi:hypothetical protein
MLVVGERHRGERIVAEDIGKKWNLVWIDHDKINAPL